jgi:hypothetical protein
MNDRVECRSETSYAERPTAVHWQGRRLEVQQVIARWREPWGVRFRVRLDDERILDLAYHQAGDTWDIEPYEGLSERSAGPSRLDTQDE